VFKLIRIRSDYDLRQIDEERINKLSETAVKNLSITLLNDFKEARERLNQTSKNSSMPPSSEAPWDKPSHYEDEEQDDESSGDIKASDKAIHADKQALASDCCADEINTPSPPPKNHQIQRHNQHPLKSRLENRVNSREHRASDESKKLLSINMNIITQLSAFFALTFSTLNILVLS
jgi:hypothetical protein